MQFTCKTLCMLAFGLLLGITSCKKGEDDPLISFRSRKARLAGQWLLQEGSASITVSGTYNETFTFSGTKLTQNTTPTGQTLIVYTGTYILNLEILKDGTFTMKENLVGIPIEAQGTWSFEKGIGEEKNKEDARFYIKTVSKGSTLDEHIFNRWGTDFTYHIKELRNKKLVIHSSGRIYSDANGYVDFSSDYTFIQ